MPDSARDAKRFVQQLWELASRLAEQDIVLASLHCDWAHFGSWTLEAQTGQAADRYDEALLAKQWDTAGPEVLRASWDGKERLLVIERAPTPPLSSPGPWTSQVDEFFSDSDAAMRFVEDYLERWAGGVVNAMRYAAVDKVLPSWLKRHGLHVMTEYRDDEVRSVDVVDDQGDLYQIWIETISERGFRVSAALRKVPALRSPFSLDTEAAGLPEALEDAYVLVASWIRDAGHTRTPVA